MKKIKLFYLSIALSLTMYSVNAQNANPYISINADPASLALNQVGNVEVVAGNAGNDQIVANSMRITLSVGLNAEILGVNATSSPKWSISTLTAGTNNTIQLINNATITDFDLPIINLNVRGTVLGGPSTITAGINYISGVNPITGAPSAAQGNAVTGDDNSTTSITVITVVPITLGTITADASECAVNLKWNTLLEEDGTTFDIEYSTNGINFNKVAKVVGNKTNATYEYSYEQGNGKGFYRLKMGNVIGGYFYSKIVGTSVKCNLKKVAVYPNPVQINQTMRVIIAGFAGKIKGDLISADGKIVSSRVLQNGVNNIVFNNLAQGTYNLKVTDDTNEIQNFKIVFVK